MRSRSLVYLTYGDVDSPVYSTQVIGFCDFLENELKIDTKLVAFVPLRLYFQQAKLMKKYDRKVMLIPVVNRWQARKWYSKLNAFIISRSTATSVMTRNPSAVHVCRDLQARGWKFFYDARGCQYKELEEFSDALPSQIESSKDCEQLAWHSADWVYSVSQQLVEHFKNELRYRNHNHSVVPCCYIEHDSIPNLTKKELFGREDVTVYCYAGALSVWNFPRSFLDLSRKILADENNRLIILSRQLDTLKEHRQFGSPHCLKLTVTPKEVGSHLAISDYGILLRKNAVTNQVASPSKFAEYISNGCRVIISPGIGDFSDMVETEDIGTIYRSKKDNKLIEELDSISEADRSRIKEIAASRFLRNSEFNLLKYRNLKSIHDGETN